MSLDRGHFAEEVVFTSDELPQEGEERKVSVRGEGL